MHLLFASRGIDLETLTPTHVKVTVSQHNLNEKSSDAYVVGVKEITLHPKYQCNKHHNDIALLELEKDIDWYEAALPACFPDPKDPNGIETFDDFIATVAGWGWTHENSQKGNVNFLT